MKISISHKYCSNRAP
ncbi:unnamed protein product [Acanthoscelides obtectus]|uniref:Uncharacterized protein n=1 Tax=Acanthoscelides obtectus TaxID=200917 RepID=A0A9P0NTB9_ACAOB|nr:unnamed protein product [Acanthoscelides obtectus]CAK1661872.1 hypothetical protein AOBTE_LOCUS22848 [Acanthoscelides obtectus]